MSRPSLGSLMSSPLAKCNLAAIRRPGGRPDICRGCQFWPTHFRFARPSRENADTYKSDRSTVRVSEGGKKLCAVRTVTQFRRVAFGLYHPGVIVGVKVRIGQPNYA